MFEVGEKKDIPTIQMFFKQIVNGHEAMYEGQWNLGDGDQEDSTSGEDSSLMAKVFGDAPSPTAYSGKVRTFFDRQETNSITLSDYFHGRKED